MLHTQLYQRIHRTGVTTMQDSECSYRQRIMRVPPLQTSLYTLLARPEEVRVRSASSLSLPLFQSTGWHCRQKDVYMHAYLTLTEDPFTQHVSVSSLYTLTARLPRQSSAPLHTKLGATAQENRASDSHLNDQPQA